MSENPALVASLPLLDACRLALHYTTDAYDSQIKEWIAEARAELERSGVSAIHTRDDSLPLVRSAIKAYCLMQYTEDPAKYEMYARAFACQQDHLRKSRVYGAVNEP